jgi:hypothetical protein
VAFERACGTPFPAAHVARFCTGEQQLAVLALHQRQHCAAAGGQRVEAGAVRGAPRANRAVPAAAV